MSKRIPLAILTSDWHLRSKVPASRMETCWYSVMKERMDYLKGLQESLSEKPATIPILAAGDIFDRWNPSSELISWALDNIPDNVWAIPGQHDLPYHDYAGRMEGAYGALVKAGKLRDLHAEEWNTGYRNLGVWAMPWGHYKPTESKVADVTVCMIHKYVWATSDTKFPGADTESNVVALKWQNLYDTVLIGDNHIPWRVGNCFNHGSLFSMSINQKDHQPRVGVLYDDRTIELLPCTAPKEMREVTTKATTDLSLSHAVVQELGTLERDNIAFDAMVARLRDDSHGRIQDILKRLHFNVFRTS